MQPTVPSLSSEGFITDIRKLADTIIAHYFASDYSQSNVFYGEITSLAYQVQLYGNDPDRLKEEIQSRCTRYLERYFDAAIVNVSINENPGGTKFGYEIVFDATVVKDNVKYNLGRLIEVQNGKMVNIIKKFQEGTT